MKPLAWLLILAGTSSSAQVYFTGVIPDPYAATRTAPGSIGTLPIMPTWVMGTQRVGLSRDLNAAFLATFAGQLTNGWIILDPTNGNDSTCKVNSGLACATWSKALRTTVDSIIYLKCPANGIFASPTFDFRFTDSGYGNGIKVVNSDKPNCHLVLPGDNIGTDTFTATAGHPGVYQTTPSCFGSTCGGISSLLRTDLNDGATYVDPNGRTQPITDEQGNAFPERLFMAAPNACAGGITYTPGQYVWAGSFTLYQAINTNTNNCPPNSNWTTLGTGVLDPSWDTAGLANIDKFAAANQAGWYQSASTGVLYVTLNGLDLTQAGNAAKLSARYYALGSVLHGGSVPRVFLYGTTLLMQNVFLDGLHFELSQYNNSGTYHNASIWAETCTVFDAQGYGAQLQGGGWSYFENCAIHANGADGLNAAVGIDTVTPSHMLRAYIRSTWAGDPHTYISGTLPGIEPVANGESSHSGYSVDFGGVYTGSIGPECADTAAASITSQSWFVGTFCADVSPFNTSNWGGFVAISQTFTSPNNRQFWIESSIGTRETVGGRNQAVYIDSPNSACKVYNAAYDLPVAGGGSCSPYTPNAP